jgi:hypothetical protein
MTSQNMIALVKQFFRTWPISNAVTFGSNDHSNPHRVSKWCCAISGSISRMNRAIAFDISLKPTKYPPPLPNLPLWFCCPEPSAPLQRQFSGKLKQASMVGSLLIAVQEFASSNIEMFLRYPSASFGRHSHS